MDKSLLTTKPRLALQRNDAGELVPSINVKTGLQDMQVAGIVTSIDSTEYVNEASGKTYFRGTIVTLVRGKEVTSPCLFNGSTIDKVEIGATYWLTSRKSEDNTITNYSCGSLRVLDLVPADVFDEMYNELLASVETAPKVTV